METEDHTILIRTATLNDIKYVNEILWEIEKSAYARGTGIAKRTPESLALKMREGKAIIALTNNGDWVGFAYIAVWDNGKFVSNSGLIVAPPYRNTGVARAIKSRIFELSREKYPEAGIFSITSGIAVMKMNSSLGFEPVTYSEITKDPQFWEGCKSCVNHAILEQKGHANCLCTAMLFDPATIAAAIVRKKQTPVQLKIA